MRTFALIIFIATSSLFACKNASQAMGADSIEPSNSSKNYTKGNIQKSVTYDVIISFISKGAGIDRKLMDKIDKVIESFNFDNEVTIAPIKISWGREGETDYNFINKNLSTSQKKSFATLIRETIGYSDMAHLSFNKKSVHKR